MTLVNEKADQLDISPSVLSSRKEIEKIIRNETNTPILSNWRLQEVGNQLLSTYKTLLENAG